MGKSSRNKRKSKNRQPQSQRPQTNPVTNRVERRAPFRGPDPSSRSPSSNASWLVTQCVALGPMLEHLAQEDIDNLSEEQRLESMLLRVLEKMYLEALRRLVDMGYDDDAAMKAILRNGHCYGDEDILMNIFNNALAYLTGDCPSRNPIFEVNGIVFTSLMQLVEHSLGCMVHVLQQIHHSRRLAMWSLLLGKLHLSAAIALPPPDDSINKNAVTADLPPCCRFNRCVGIQWLGNSGVFLDRSAVLDEGNNYQPKDEEHLQKDIEVPERFGLSLGMKSMLKKNVAKVAAAVRTNSMHLLPHTLMPSGASVKGDAPAVSAPEVHGESSVLGHKEWVKPVMDTLCGELSDLNLDGNFVDLPEDRKDAIILHLQNQIKVLEKQVKEREAWARQKAIQAEESVDSALLELETLRKEMAESRHLLKKGKPTLDASTMMKLSEKESELRKVRAQVEATHAAMTRVENEKAEIRAELESFNLSASESANTFLEIAKREKKNQKKLLGSEKQKAKLQEEIAEERRKITDLQQQLVEIEQASREAEIKWRQEADAKELANAQLKEEKRALEAAKADGKKRLKDLRLRIEVESKLERDKVLSLEQELSALKIAAGNTEATAELETLLPVMHGLDEQDGRKCIICRKNEVCVVFLPCAHEIMCANCSDRYGYKDKVSCPMCQVPIEEAIRVFRGS
ncbi:hypothetical protein BT93_E0209 [Corymbia citriodora subsp. variegata]|nr:hypothetical protein BT93_E0209 [Corymbia citriodora subsp. variegata]